ncbi:hypothetical protein [Streptomyces sp. NPDC012888]|uniref:hypothetical protein n=1 Tax=Streptomyces sp. NPDC012888 TaxID=3364855 RepID=UPI0036BBBD68
MTASRKPASSNSSSNRSGSDGSTTRERATGAARAGAKTAGETAGEAKEETAGTLTALPSRIAEKTATAAQAVRSTAGPAGPLGSVWTLVRGRGAVPTGAAGALVLVAVSYATGRRAGLRRRGPLSRLTGGRL